MCQGNGAPGSLDLLHPPRLFKLRVGFPEIVELDESAATPTPPAPSRVRVAAGEERERVRCCGVGAVGKKLKR